MTTKLPTAIRPSYKASYVVGPHQSNLPQDAAPLLARLMDMFTYCRPDEGLGESAFIAKFILPHTPTLIDAAGNIHIDRRISAENTTLFVAHCDSVHHTDGRQSVAYDKDQRIIHTLGEVLGADDAAGVCILLHLLEHQVPGYYLFTRGEECGGIGARYLAKNFGNELEQFDRAIAFDRRDNASIITHQGWGRTASDAFADALAAQLNNAGLHYAPDDGGVYTDTKEFAGIIGECTNVSVGYMHEHTDMEILRFDHFQKLAQAVLGVDWDSLPMDRLPGEDDYSLYSAGRASWEEPVQWGDYTELDDSVVQALTAAEEGFTYDLVFLIAEAVCPEDVDQAVDMLDEERITSQLLRQARSDLKTVDGITVLYRLFDDLASYRCDTARDD